MKNVAIVIGVLILIAVLGSKMQLLVNVIAGGFLVFILLVVLGVFEKRK
jgi:cytochrome c biogenesis protein CcdA